MAVRFQRRLSLDEVERAIERLELAIKVPYPAILHLYLESGALKDAAHSAGKVAEPGLHRTAQDRSVAYRTDLDGQIA